MTDGITQTLTHPRLSALRRHLVTATTTTGSAQVETSTLGIGTTGPRNGDVAQQIKDECLPLTVDKSTGVTLPREIEKLRARQRQAVAVGDYQAALLLEDLLFSVEPRPALTLEDCAPSTLEAKREFFLRNGFVVVPAALQGEVLMRVQQSWARAQAPSRQLWEEAKQVGELPEPLDGIYFKNLNPYQRPYAPELERFAKLPHGRKFFDFPHEEFFREAAAGGDPALLDLVDPPSLVETLCAVCAADHVETDDMALNAKPSMPLRCIGIQPRTVPPDGEGGYTTWHRGEFHSG
eukprot:COSAG02_NODE_5339_length_4421_cov_1.716104_5_plen_293_part_00